jgi:NAD(P)-dependent dehydrogenase (short-subunit alcohol dehydrogenase family)
MLDRQASSLDSKIALVTGSGGGIGRSIAETFAAHGASVVVVDKREAAAREVAEAIGKRGGQAIAVPVDVTQAAGIEQMKKAALERFGRVDVLVNNVGNFMPGAGPFLRTKESDWEGLYEINLKHILRATHALAPAMVERRSGCIINVSTIETLRGIPGRRASRPSPAASPSRSRPTACASTRSRPRRPTPTRSPSTAGSPPNTPRRSR